MAQLSTFETTGAREEVVHLSQLWATTPFVRSMTWLVSPASVETIALNLLVVFRDDRPCQPPWLKVSENHGTHLCSSPSCLSRNPCSTPFLPFWRFSSIQTNSGSSNVASSGMPDMSIHRPSWSSGCIMVVNVVVLGRIGAVVPLIVV